MDLALNNLQRLICHIGHYSYTLHLSFVPFLMVSRLSYRMLCLVLWVNWAQYIHGLFNTSLSIMIFLMLFIYPMFYSSAGFQIRWLYPLQRSIPHLAKKIAVVQVKTPTDGEVLAPEIWKVWSISSLPLVLLLLELQYLLVSHLYVK